STKIEGFESLSIVDVANCQPYLLSIMLKLFDSKAIASCYDSLEYSLFENIKFLILGGVSSLSFLYASGFFRTFLDPVESRECFRFSELARTGRLYEWFIDETDRGRGTPLTRDEAKETML